MKTALINLDMINEICHPKGKLAKYSDRISKSHTLANINDLNSWGRKQGHLIIHVRLGFSSHYLDCSTISPIFSAAETNHAVAIDEWGGQFCEDLDIEPQDIQVTKHRVSAFYGTDLDLILRANQIETLILAGVATNNAVELTAREAHDRDYRVQVMKDATECASDEEQMASLNFLSRIAAIRTTKELIL